MTRNETVKKCLFPVGGLGTRFLPATKELPKEMLPLLDRPIISYGVDEAVSSGCTSIIFVTGRNKTSIEDYFDSSGELEQTLLERGNSALYELIKEIPEKAQFMSVRQPRPLGLGHAVLCGECLCSDSFFGIILPDDVMVSEEEPVLSQLIHVHEKHGGSVIALERVGDEDVSRYGIALVSEEIEEGVFRILDLVEKPARENAPSNLAIMGRYVLSPRIFDYLKVSGKGAGNEYQLTDALKMMIKKETLWGYAYKGQRLDCGTLQGWLDATVRLALSRNELRVVVEKALSQDTLKT
ncbi:MAG: UTP--glucose-1-phosphate uridylyltransferase GalU [Synergistales bacterium]|nr:UTP--glucose-1-phosphate uridylyltransferase GalU [Synergistales bacterium]